MSFDSSFEMQKYNKGVPKHDTPFLLFEKTFSAEKTRLTYYHQDIISQRAPINKI